jgi:hypothetical protein
MEENNKLKELTLEELQKEQKKYKSIATIFVIVIFLFIITSIYFAYKNNSYKMFLFLGGFSGVIYALYDKLKKLETEIKSRNSQS